MKRTMLFIFIFVSMTLLVSACKKKEETPIPKSPAQQAPVPMHPVPMQPEPMAPSVGNVQKTEKKIVVPESVKKWNRVKLVFLDKTTNKSTEYIIKVGSEWKVPNTNLKIMVGEFLPDFRMTETEITSSSDMPNNPALRVEIFEDGKSIFKGWLYAKFPMIHPFEHPKYGLSLKEGLKG